MKRRQLLQSVTLLAGGILLTGGCGGGSGSPSSGRAQNTLPEPTGAASTRLVNVSTGVNGGLNYRLQVDDSEPTEPLLEKDYVAVNGLQPGTRRISVFYNDTPANRWYADTRELAPGVTTVIFHSPERIDYDNEVPYQTSVLGVNRAAANSEFAGVRLCHLAGPALERYWRDEEFIFQFTSDTDSLRLDRQKYASPIETSLRPGRYQVRVSRQDGRDIVNGEVNIPEAASRYTIFFAGQQNSTAPRPYRFLVLRDQ